MAGDVNGVESPKILRFIMFSREAFWEAIGMKTSSPCAVDAISNSISELLCKQRIVRRGWLRLGRDFGFK